MVTQLLEVVAPVFGVAFVGWLFAGFKKIDLAPLADVVIYLAAPALVFASLLEKRVELSGLFYVGGGAVFQTLVCGAVAWGVFRAARIEGRGLYLATMFPNTGNLGLPLALFAFGSAGLSAAIIVFVAISLVHYSLGLMIVSGQGHPGEALKMPLMHAALLGVALALAGVEIPGPLMRGIALLGDATVPVMLLSLGIRMRSVRLRKPGRALLVVALRMVPGLGAALVWVTVFGLEGPERGVVLVTGVLPSAVMNFVLTEAYGESGEEVASAILLGTLLAILAIPAVLGFVV